MNNTKDDLGEMLDWSDERRTMMAKWRDLSDRVTSAVAKKLFKSKFPKYKTLADVEKGCEGPVIAWLDSLLGDDESSASTAGMRGAVKEITPAMSGDYWDRFNHCGKYWSPNIRDGSLTRDRSDNDEADGDDVATRGKRTGNLDQEEIWRKFNNPPERPHPTKRK